MTMSKVTTRLEMDLTVVIEESVSIEYREVTQLHISM